jgi:hypothetical protein
MEELQSPSHLSYRFTLGIPHVLNDVENQIPLGFETGILAEAVVCGLIQKNPPKEARSRFQAPFMRPNHLQCSRTIAN